MSFFKLIGFNPKSGDKKTIYVGIEEEVDFLRTCAKKNLEKSKELYVTTQKDKNITVDIYGNTNGVTTEIIKTKLKS